MKKRKLYLSIAIITPVILCLAVYIALAVYYQGSFSFGTWVNGIYCTGKNVSEINEELCDGMQERQLQIITGNGEKEVLELSTISYTEDYQEPLAHMKSNQNSFLWGQNLFISKSQVLIPVISYDVKALEEKVGNLSFMKRNTENTVPEVVIEKSDAGYYLKDTTHNVIDKEKAIHKIANAITDFEEVIDLYAENCYAEYDITPEMQQTYALWEKVERFQNFHKCYVFGETKEVIDPAIVADWITLDEAGNFALDENGELQLNTDAIAAYIAVLATKYDTIGGSRQFKATRGDMVTIEGGTYGNELNQETETAYLTQAFLAHDESDREPEYIKKAWQQGQDDIGNTYIEVDMTMQMMYYYKDGTLQLETPIVTGNTSLKRGTPERVCYVYAKQKNRILRGPDYASHVNFWMPVNGNIGIHDASWRKKYGGEIYKTAGSHGCINTPYDAMASLYDMVEIGTPVVMFY